MSNAKYPRTVRLVTPDEFAYVFENGRKHTAEYFRAFLCANELDQVRLGPVAGKRSFPRAVDRNRIKRIIRESFRHHQQELKGCDMIIVAFRQAQSATNSELFACLEQLWSVLAKA